ncbi:hypothetical protein M8Z33_32360 [Streptomyces sp. ZAF1911]|uniref:hypothetical protein n=1 Tax=Streptomyces sp. ZAF1911 TaxID=2944129 RepID=UPI00237A446D|nr:hypothetical protein [Streptomyces sp. ZAF1911]MDD9381264.1 hypothetical protein [Streptomyces sp. ZAF1911]
MKTHFAAALGSVVLTAVTLLGAPAADAQTTTTYPTSDFNINFGATWTRGTVTWYNRSVRVIGQHRSAVSDSAVTCRTTWAYSLQGNRAVIGQGGGSPTACGTIASYDFVVPADQPGGAAYVRVCLDDGNLKDLACKLIARPLQSAS